MKTHITTYDQARKIASQLKSDEGRLVFMDAEELAVEFKVPALLRQIQRRAPIPPTMPVVLISGETTRKELVLTFEIFRTPFGPVLHVEMVVGQQATHTYISIFRCSGFNLIAHIAEFPLMFVIGTDRYGHMSAADLPLVDPDLPKSLYAAALRSATPNRDYARALSWTKERVSKETRY